MDFAGNLNTYGSYADYMDKTSGSSSSAAELLPADLTFETTQSPDFMLIDAPTTLKARGNPFFLQILENGELTAHLQHLD